MRRRPALAAAALASFALAALLALLAVDVTAWQGALRRGDVLYRAAPAEEGLWQAQAIVPLDPARSLLGLDDDLAFRRALRALRLARLGDGLFSDPELALLRGRAQTELQAVVDSGADRPLRSRALALLGVLRFAGALSEVGERATLLGEAASDFQAAIALDRGNDEAKANLELVLQRSRGLQAAEGAGGPNPSPGGAGAKGAGAGTPGSGY